jgi:hypothetical protein
MVNVAKRKKRRKNRINKTIKFQGKQKTTQFCSLEDKFGKFFLEIYALCCIYIVI